MKKFSLVYAILFLSQNGLMAQSIPPQYPNKIVDGKKEEEWVEWFDKDWERTDMQDSLEYFRKLNYVDGVSDGLVNYTYISDDYQLYQVSSTAKIVDLKEDKTLAIKDITVYGGIDYDANHEKIITTLVNSGDLVLNRIVAHQSIKGEETWPFLTGTKSEVVNNSSLAENSKIKVQSYSSHQATEESYKNLQGQNYPSILHIATHGFFYSIKKK